MPIMAFHVKDVTSESDFFKITAIQFDAFDAIEAAAERAIEAPRMVGVNSHWSKIVENSTVKIAAAGWWHVYEHDPYTGQPSPQCP